MANESPSNVMPLGGSNFNEPAHHVNKEKEFRQLVNLWHNTKRGVRYDQVPRKILFVDTT